MRKKLNNAVKDVQSGKNEAFALLYEEFKQPTYFRAVNIVGEVTEAEDIVQEVFIAAFQKIKSLQNPETFPSWLNKITVSKCADFLRKRQAAESEPDGAVNGDFEQVTDEKLIPDTAVANAETARIIYEIIQQLPLPQRACVYFFYYERLTVAEIAAELSCNENTVKTRLSLAREKIRAELEKREDEDGLKLYNAVPLLLIPIMKIAAAFTADFGRDNGYDHYIGGGDGGYCHHVNSGNCGNGYISGGENGGNGYIVNYGNCRDRDKNRHFGKDDCVSGYRRGCRNKRRNYRGDIAETARIRNSTRNRGNYNRNYHDNYRNNNDGNNDN